MAASSRLATHSSSLALLAATVVALGAGPTAAQIPQEFTNLQHLPGDVDRGELIGLMRGFSGALGVRCSYCHTVSDQLNQPDDDFASDERANKQKARLMMQMVDRINTETLAMLPSRRSPNIEVDCQTCHGGVPRPIPIDEAFEAELDGDGLDAAVAQYRDLRERYLGTRAFDFSFRPLNALAERLVANDRAAAAAGVMELNAEFHATSPPTLLLLGQVHERNDDSAAAIAAYRRILDLDPATPFLDFYAGQARERIQALGG